MSENTSSYTRWRLCRAMKKGSLDMVEKCLEGGVPVDAKNDAGWTPLHSAAYSGYVKSAKLLLMNGADPRVRTNAGDTPLHLAANSGYEEIVIALLDSGAAVNELNHGWTPLNCAGSGGHTEVAKLLRERGGTFGRVVSPVEDRHPAVL